MNHEQAVKEWDMQIEGKSSFFQLNLKDVWRYRDLLLLLVKRDFISFYKQTLLGPLWFLLQPLFTTITFVFIFGNLAGLSTDGLPQPLFYMTGIVAWGYFADCLNKTSTVFRDNASIFGKVYFPRLIMPLSIVLSNLIRLVVQIFMLLILFVYYLLFKDYQLQINGYILLLPVYLLIMAALGLGLGMIISAMTTKYRDLSFLISFGVQLFMYATPVIYPLSSVPDKYKSWLLLNPMTHVTEGMRYGLLGQGSFSMQNLMITIVATGIILLFGVIVFNRVEKNFIDTI